MHEAAAAAESVEARQRALERIARDEDDARALTLLTRSVRLPVSLSTWAIASRSICATSSAARPDARIAPRKSRAWIPTAISPPAESSAARAAAALAGANSKSRLNAPPYAASVPFWNVCSMRERTAAETRADAAMYRPMSGRSIWPQ